MGASYREPAGLSSRLKSYENAEQEAEGDHSSGEDAAQLSQAADRVLACGDPARNDLSLQHGNLLAKHQPDNSDRYEPVQCSAAVPASKEEITPHVRMIQVTGAPLFSCG